LLECQNFLQHSSLCLNFFRNYFDNYFGLTKLFLDLYIYFNFISIYIYIYISIFKYCNKIILSVQRHVVRILRVEFICNCVRGWLQFLRNAVDMWDKISKVTRHPASFSMVIASEDIILSMCHPNSCERNNGCFKAFDRVARRQLPFTTRVVPDI